MNKPTKNQKQQKFFQINESEVERKTLGFTDEKLKKNVQMIVTEWESERHWYMLFMNQKMITNPLHTEIKSYRLQLLQNKPTVFCLFSLLKVESQHAQQLYI